MKSGSLRISLLGRGIFVYLRSYFLVFDYTAKFQLRHLSNTIIIESVSVSGFQMRCNTGYLIFKGLRHGKHGFLLHSHRISSLRETTDRIANQDLGALRSKSWPTSCQYNNPSIIRAFRWESGLSTAPAVPTLSLVNEEIETPKYTLLFDGIINGFAQFTSNSRRIFSSLTMTELYLLIAIVGSVLKKMLQSFKSICSGSCCN